VSSQALSSALVVCLFCDQTIDYYWFLDLNYSYVYLDGFGRVQPDPVRFPSSRGSSGFKALAAYAHSKGLLFGIHTMRGISPEAIMQRRPVLNTTYTADEVYESKGACPWMLTTRPFYSLNMSHPGGQAFYNSLYAQYAEWGVDFIKNDCVYGNFVPDQIDAVSKAIDNSGRRMLYSLSPGSSNNDWAKRVVQEVNMYRVTGDTWDRWSNIASHFPSAQQMAPFIGLPNGRYGLPSWPDLDMLPLGWLGIEGGVGAPVRPCNLTRDEQVTLMSLWTIFRSPLMYGGDFQHPDPFTISLLTNTEALAITDNSTNTDSVLLSDIAAVWRSDSSSWRDDGLSYFSVHNLADFTHTLNVSVVSVRGQQSGGSCVLRDVWERKDVDTGAAFAFSLNQHASGLYALHSCKADESTMTASN
jgi:alpha-galactosidase